MATKRKYDTADLRNQQSDAKRQAVSTDEIKTRFRNGLFENNTLETYTQDYAESIP